MVFVSSLQHTAFLAPLGYCKASAQVAATQLVTPCSLGNSDRKTAHTIVQILGWMDPLHPVYALLGTEPRVLGKPGVHSTNRATASTTAVLLGKTHLLGINKGASLGRLGKVSLCSHNALSREISTQAIVDWEESQRRREHKPSAKSPCGDSMKLKFMTFTASWEGGATHIRTTS